MTNKQKPREDGWYYRSDGAYPYQNWCPFEHGQVVEVKNESTGDSRVDLVENLWWGYTGGMEGEAVINYARLATPFQERAEKWVKEVTADPARLAETLARVDITPAEALRRHTAIRRGALEALRDLDDPETDVFIEVYHKSSVQRLKVPASVKDQARRLIVAIENESRESFIKEYVDV